MSTISVTRFKQCNKCECWKPLTPQFFPKHRGSADGYENRCVGCKRLEGRWHYYANQQAYIDKSKRWYESNKKRHHAAVAAWILSNKSKVAFYQARWSQANKERKRLYSSARRARVAGNGGDIAVDELMQMYGDQDGLCAYCECQLNNDYEIDHMLPVIRGGHSGWENIALSCTPCNRRKAKKSAEEFMEVWLRK